MSNNQQLFLKDKSGAYVNTDDSSLSAFNSAREEAKVTKHVMKELSEIRKELVEIKDFMVEIKTSLEV